jgi:cysteine-rich repeat protein
LLAFGCGGGVVADTENDAAGSPDVHTVADGGTDAAMDAGGDDQGYTSDGGDETEIDGGTCAAGSDPCPNGDECCVGLLCLKGTCQTSICGDGYTDKAKGEECDDQNPTSGDGCEPGTCKYSCVSTDTTRNCKSTDPCIEDGTCDDTVTHTCTKGADKKDGTLCDTGKICVQGVCTVSICGDGITDPALNEECDFGPGNNVDGSGCEHTCKFTCTATPTDSCPDSKMCNGTERCEAMTFEGHGGQKCSAGTPLDKGTPCDTGKICADGDCVDSVCGDEFIDNDKGEECEDGNLNPGDGCEPVTCKFTCLSTDSSRDCRSANDCVNDGVCDDSVTHLCVPGNSKDNGTPCGTDGFCTDGKCNQSSCGDGYTDESKNEQCDDGNPVSGDGCEPVTCKFSCSDPAKDCSAAPVCKKNECSAKHVCQVVADSSQDGNVCGNGLVCKGGGCETPPQVCGNSKVESPEECDDGNETPGDGCEPVSCKYSCHVPADDCAAAPACNKAVCADVDSDGGKIGQKCGTVPTDEGNSTADCIAPNTCKSGKCTPPASQCDNGIVEPGEDCDYGQGFNLAGSGCEPNCKFSCTKVPTDNCSDNNPCNGVEACTTVTVNGRTGQKCNTGTPPKDGTSCGGSNICLGGQCKGSTCGDGFVDQAKNEQCDFGPGANLPGSGCEPTCLFTCQTTPTDTCPDTNQCNGTETCSFVNIGGHLGQNCSAGSQLTNGTPCGSGGFCTAGQCNPSICGDGYVDQSKGEECDDMNIGSGDGCEPVTCKFTCLSSDPTRNCASTDSCYNNGTCGSDHKCVAGGAKGDGTPCTGGGFCTGGVCKPSACGDGYVDGSKNEECDDTNPVSGDGCENNCKWTCLASDLTRNCASANSCVNDGTCGTDHKCVAGSAKGNGTICTGGYCTDGVCKPSTCGDGYIDGSKGEQCEPPNTATCDQNCHTIVPAKCGDNILAASEQCDDNNGTPHNLDGCDTNCMYEMMLRMSAVSISASQSPTGCNPRTNKFGTSVLTSTAVGQLNTTLTDSVNAGEVNVLLQMLGLDDLTGNNDSSLQIGIMTAILDPAKGTWPGSNPIDWWYLVSPTGLDTSDLPLSKFVTASIASKQVSAGPDDVTMSLLLGGSTANLLMRSARLFATVDPSTAPNVPAPPPTLIKNGVTVMQTVDGTASGKGLCGNITVESLSKIPVPEALTSGTAACSSSCSGSKAYTYCGSGQPVGPGCNSLLDVIVGGCKAVPLFGSCLVGVINATQPDVSGDGYAGTLTNGTNNKVPASQTTGNTRAYSAFFTFKANRAHATGKTP